ncbi:pyridoxal phosphate-dependent decarboxylase family protein [Streptococcus agalactiae]|uniref:pyridoxal phosphate-dependent decarboxylase family protein n=2 Tax=Streptococcus agalactiae TaxID=1311 RepID=UPI0013750055|nr:pyridoxal-dependent decarboxylase [Streptococcus agalactiae]KAF1101647.1 pyridoxal-dependent decarboxylase [Streptococcus agalactiae]KAF1201004.1 pyridoxal-dependent decarboxylase [Streptococcus agalactiae]MCD0086680.1 pyridoxal-dependent decarboxylase [Streptococcus agalactiae]MCD0107599.1 pyridoxal-dependent decarboxylase [Streptococcus agalactiae]HEM9292926.1 pyridoxal-dependent decarboxylase [Streptococcus agalactiae]
METNLLTKENKNYFENEINKLVNQLINWKVNNTQVHDNCELNNFINLEPIPQKGQELNDSIKTVINSLGKNINFSSTTFMGFPDSGNSLPGLIGGIIEVFLQQNLINKDICSPWATEIEANVINWLRSSNGYTSESIINDVTQLGGAVTTGGVMSNTYALMAAKKKYPYKNIVILPDNIGHYSLSYATEWLNLDVEIIYCKTYKYRIDKNYLQKLIDKYGNRIMFIGVYACDSMTSTCEDLKGIYELIKENNLETWIHCDACHGFVLNFSTEYKNKVSYLSKFDSCTLDPHKVLWLPYTMSVILMKNPDDFARLSRGASLIMDDPLSFGKTTPFIGSKSFDSLKLWMVMKTIGVQNLGEMIEKRIKNAKYFYEKITNSDHFSVENDEIIYSVIFQYLPLQNLSQEKINELNRQIYNKMISDGKYYFHGFSINVEGTDKFVLRYNSGNINISNDEIRSAMLYVEKLGKEIFYDKNRIN